MQAETRGRERVSEREMDRREPGSGRDTSVWRRSICPRSPEEDKEEEEGEEEKDEEAM